jgi:hypothetical protein
MNEIITWAAQHNTIVIQVVFSIVLLLILVYVYRLFFVNSPSSTAGDSSVELTEVNQKLDQLLEQQKSSGIQVIEKIVPAASTDADAKAVADSMASPASNAGELEQAKAENAKLKAQLNELEKKVFELTPIAGAEDAAQAESAKVDNAQLIELNKKVEELQSRLSEYDIIADDIAELSQLRAENAELKKKIENGGGESRGSGSSGGGDAGGSSGETQAVASETEEVPSAEQPSASTEALAEAEAVAAVAETAPTGAGEIPGFDAETSALLDSLVAETDAAAQAAESPAEALVAEAAPETTHEEPKITMDQNIPETEKNLINEFEKSIQKGS